MKPFNLFFSLQLGDLLLKNRIFMDSLTRTRVLERGVISPMAATYYAQRASAGLIISETINIASGHEDGTLKPGLYTGQQIEGWQKVTQAVHAKDGKIFAKLDHNDSFTLYNFDDEIIPVTNSDNEFMNAVHTISGQQDKLPVPRPLTRKEIAANVLLYRQAAINAKSAGFDGVEMNGSNAGLVKQFLHPVSNFRTDEYGGALENRARLMLEILDALIDVFGKDRVGLRMSTHDLLCFQYDTELVETNIYLSRQCSMRGIAYLHILEPAVMDDDLIPFPTENPNIVYYIREYFKGVLIVNGSYTRASGNKLIETGDVDAIAFGRAFIANPDLPERFKHDFPLHQIDPATYYGSGPEGYINYPPLNQMLE